MDGVGARLGRSSARYAPTTVFTGPVRRWKKKWIHGTPPNSVNNHHNRTTTNGGVNGSNGSHLLLFKWIPITASQNNNGNTDSSVKDDDVLGEVPRKRKFKYIPINVLEELKNDASEQDEDEIKPIESDEEPTSQADGFDEKPDINDVPMEESQASQKRPPERQDLNERTLDLSLG